MTLLSPQDWQQQGQYFKYKNHQVFYRTAGVGEPLVLIHGFPTSSWDWYKVWDKLAQNYHVIAFDMTGFGFSDKPRSYEYSIHDQADLFEALARHLAIKQCHLLVHDYGNTVAQEILARHDESKNHGFPKINSVCFLNGGLFPEMHRALLVQKILKSPFGIFLTYLNSKNTLRKSFEKLYGPAGIEAAEIDGYWQIICHQNGHRLLHKLIHYISDRRRHRARWVGALQQTHVPLRLIDGPEDPVSGRHLAEYYLEMIPNPDVVLIEGAGHYPQTEAPEAVLKHYFEFRDMHV
ncbi:MAG: alpha/beta hydrolase [Spirosomaceae bacterium]|nr:alpha/beta hydrolase [Spirosomataceae bacterium]